MILNALPAPASPGVVVLRALVAARSAAGAPLAVLADAVDPVTGRAASPALIDADPATPAHALTPRLAGLTLDLTPMLAAARRQRRALIVPTAEAPARTSTGKLPGFGLPAWAVIFPVLPGAGGLPTLVAFVEQPPSAAALAALGGAVAGLDAALRGVAVAASAGAAPARPTPAVPGALADSIDLLLSGLRDGLAVIGADGAVVSANRMGRELLQVIQAGEIARLTHPALCGPHAAALTGGNAADAEFVSEREPRRHVQVRAAAAALAGAVLLTLRDVTGERLLQERLLQSEKMASIGQLVSGVAHELNNPLTGIMGFAQLLQLRDLPEPARREVALIHDEAERAARIVQNLLSFARRRRPEKEPVPVNALIERVLALRRYELQVHNITPHARLSPRARPVLADPDQLQQVLLNVVGNAEQAIHARGGSGAITLTTLPRVDDGRDWLRITIADDGGGVAPEHVRRVFDPFFTTKPVGEGTGLGLAICYGIVDEHGGRISLASTPGKGTTVTIELPVATAVPACHSDPAPSAAPVSRARRACALVVDDEPSIRDLLATALAADGQLVATAADGITALQRLADQDFDVIISDVKMPGVDGIEFYRRVREWDAAVARRIIFTSGDLVNQATRAFLDSIENPHIAKPFQLSEIRRLVAAVLGEARTD